MQSVSRIPAGTARKIPTTPDHAINLRTLLEVDVVGILARRFRIDPATARAHAEAFGFGGQQ